MWKFSLEYSYKFKLISCNESLIHFNVYLLSAHTVFTYGIICCLTAQCSWIHLSQVAYLFIGMSLSRSN